MSENAFIWFEYIILCFIACFYGSSTSKFIILLSMGQREKKTLLYFKNCIYFDSFSLRKKKTNHLCIHLGKTSNRRRNKKKRKSQWMNANYLHSKTIHCIFFLFSISVEHSKNLIHTQFAVSYRNIINILCCDAKWKKKVRTKVQQFKMNSITTFLDCQKVFFVFFFVWSRGLHILTLFCYFHASQICMFYTQCDVFEWLWFGRPKDYCRVYENTIDVICICSVW